MRSILFFGAAAIALIAGLANGLDIRDLGNLMRMVAHLL